MVNKFMVNTVDVPSLLELFKFCLTVEAKEIAFFGEAANVYRGNIKDIYCINGKGKLT